MRKEPTRTATLASALAAALWGAVSTTHCLLAEPPASPSPSTHAARLLSEAQAAGLFSNGPEGARELVAVGRFLATQAGRRADGVALLTLGVERLRSGASGGPACSGDDVAFLSDADLLALARAEVALGEASEDLGARLGSSEPPFEMGLVPRFDGTAGRARLAYDGAAWSRALAALDALALRGAAPNPELALLRERSRGGSLRARYPVPSLTFSGLLAETAAWLDLVEGAEAPSVLEPAADRLGAAALGLGRLLLAAGKSAELAALASRVKEAGTRVELLLEGEARSRSLASRAALLAALRGDGGAPFPQVAPIGYGPEPALVKIEGELGRLVLALHPSPAAKGARAPRVVLAVPLLPVPGSLRVSSDGRTAAWLEASTPTSITPVVVSLETGKPIAAGGDPTLLAGGRPSRDRGRRHVITKLVGFSDDGARVALATTAWDTEAPPAPRLTVLSTATGQPLLDTPSHRLGFKRLRRAMR